MAGIIVGKAHAKLQNAQRLRTPVVSVLIVNYKVYDLLAGCLDALAADPDSASFEIVVVDHESDRAQMDAITARHANVRVLARDDNRGFGAGINEAARHAAGDRVLVLNPDTRVQPGAIGRLSAYLDAHPDVAAVGPRVVWPDARVQPTGRRFPSAFTGLFGRTAIMTRLWPDNPISRRDLPSGERLQAPLEVDWIAGTCMLVRAAAFRDVGGFDERFFLYWEDADLCQRLRARGGRIVYVPGAVVIHFAAKSSDRALVPSIVAFHRSALRYYVRYQRGPSRVIAVPFAAVALFARMLIRLAGVPFRR